MLRQRDRHKDGYSDGQMGRHFDQQMGKTYGQIEMGRKMDRDGQTEDR